MSDVINSILRDAKKREQLKNLETYNQQALQQQKVVKAQKEETITGFWGTVGNNLLGIGTAALNLVYNPEPYVDEDGTYKVEYSIAHLLPVYTREVTEDKYKEVVDYKKNQSATSGGLGRFLDDTLEGIGDATRSVLQSIYYPINASIQDIKEGNNPFTQSEKSQAIRKLNEELNNPDLPEITKKELERIRDGINDTPGFFLKAAHWINNTTVGKLQLEDREDSGLDTEKDKAMRAELERRVLNSSQSLQMALSRYKGEIDRNFLWKEFDKEQFIRSQRSAQEQAYESETMRERGRITSITDDSMLAPLDNTQVQDRQGRFFPMEMTDGSLWDAKRIVLDENCQFQ